MIQGEFCLCIENALKRVKPERKVNGTCSLCRPYQCNLVGHPENLPKAIAERLKKNPYWITGRTAARYARHLARRQMLKTLDEGRKAMAEGRVKTAYVGHCQRCSRYLPLVAGRCEVCSRI